MTFVKLANLYTRYCQERAGPARCPHGDRALQPSEVGDGLLQAREHSDGRNRITSTDMILLAGMSVSMACFG